MSSRLSSALSPTTPQQLLDGAAGFERLVPESRDMMETPSRPILAPARTIAQSNSESREQMRHSEHVWGGLKCHVVDRLPPGREPRLGVVLCHGYGAPGTDLLAIGGAILQVAPELAEFTQFLFPEAPVDMTELGLPGGRAWWPLNVQLLQQQLATRDFAAIRNVAPPGLVSAGTQLRQALADWQADCGLVPSRIIPGGFSQGAMVTVEVLASATEQFAGAILLSGTLIHADAWSEGLRTKPGLPIFQSHGHYDFVLPFAAATWLRELLESSGGQVRFVEFAGGHEIPWEVLEELGAFLLQHSSRG